MLRLTIFEVRSHVIVDGVVKQTDGRPFARGCSVCGFPEAICVKYPACRGEKARVDPGTMDGKVRNRRRKRA